MGGQDVHSDSPNGGPGRPRDPRVDDAILDSTVTLLGTHGVAGLTIDALIAHANVTRSMLYRRWRSKEDVVRAAIARAFDTELTTPDSGDLRTDLIDELRSLIVMLTSSPVGRLFPGLMAEAARDPGWAKMWASVTRERRQQGRLIVERALARGELRRGTDPDVVIDMVAGVVYTRVLVRRVPVTPDDAADIVNAALPAFVEQVPAEPAGGA